MSQRILSLIVQDQGVDAALFETNIRECRYVRSEFFEFPEPDKQIRILDLLISPCLEKFFICSEKTFSNPMSFAIPVNKPDDSVRETTFNLLKSVVIDLSSETKGCVLKSTTKPSAIDAEPPLPKIYTILSVSYASWTAVYNDKMFSVGNLVAIFDFS